VHAVVARSTFRSQNVQSTPAPDHIWKLRCRKSARRCGAKHISKSKCTKHLSFGALLRVTMWKKCTPLWREARFEVNMLKTQGVRTAKLRCRKSARRCCAKHISKSKCSKHQGFGPLWRFRCRFGWQAQGIVHLVKSEQNVRVLWHFQLQPQLHHTTFQYATRQLQLHLRYIPLRYTTLHWTTLHSTTLHHTPLHSTPLHYTTLHPTTPHYTKLHYITLHITTLHSTTRRYITLHYTPLHYTTFNYTTLHYTTLHSATLQLH